MGSWSRTINTVIQNPSKEYYFNISFTLPHLGGMPDHFWIEPPYSFSEEGREWVLQNMEEEEEVKLFHQMLSTFRFLE